MTESETERQRQLLRERERLRIEVDDTWKATDEKWEQRGRQKEFGEEETNLWFEVNRGSRFSEYSI